RPGAGPGLRRPGAPAAADRGDPAGRADPEPEPGLAPDLLRGVHDELELAPFLVDGQHVAGRGGGEPALRADGQVLKRNVPGRLVDPAPQVLLGFKVRDLGGREGLLPIGTAPRPSTTPSTAWS